MDLRNLKSRLCCDFAISGDAERVEARETSHKLVGMTRSVVGKGTECAGHSAANVVECGCELELCGPYPRAFAFSVLVSCVLNVHRGFSLLFCC